MTLDFYISSIRRSGRDLSGQCGGSHLTAGHTVNRIVDENDGDVFTSGAYMDGFRRTNGSQISITLICKHHVFRFGSFHTGGNGGCSAVRSLDHIAIEVVVCKHGAAYGSNAHSSAFTA